MKKLIFLLLISTTSFSQTCIELQGQYKLDQCTIKQSKDQLFVHNSNPILMFMGKPGERYGHLLSRAYPSLNSQLNIKQSDCNKILFTQTKENPAQFEIHQGHFPYFGARSPIFVDTFFEEDAITQKMLITKFTTISNGVRKVTKNIEYTSRLTKTIQNKLELGMSFVYGDNKEKEEAVTCSFSQI